MVRALELSSWAGLLVSQVGSCPLLARAGCVLLVPQTHVMMEIVAVLDQGLVIGAQEQSTHCRAHHCLWETRALGILSWSPHAKTNEEKDVC